MITRTIAYSITLPETIEVSKTEEFDDAFRTFQLLRACEEFLTYAHPKNDLLLMGWGNLLTEDVKRIQHSVVSGGLVSVDDLGVLRSALFGALERIPVPSGAYRSIEEALGDGVKAINWLLESNDE